ncbi:MAG: cytochrome P450 [Sporichthyaceae bacterium]
MHVPEAIVGRVLRFGVGVAAAGSAVYVAKRPGTVPLSRSLARWLANHAPVRVGFRLAAKSGDPLARMVTDPAIRADPHPYYDELRAEPVVGGKTSAVTARHRIVGDVLRNPAFKAGLPYEELPAPMRLLLKWGEDPSLVNPIDRPSMILMNGPEHLVYRRLAMKAFTARAIEGLRTHIEQIADDLLDAMAAMTARGEDVDLVRDYADVLPVLVIADILGVPVSMRPQFREWATQMVSGADFGVSFREARHSEEGIRALGDWMLGHLQSLRENPGDNLLSTMIAAADSERRDGVQIDDRGLGANAGLLLLAGFETTVNLIGNGVDLMLRHPDQLAQLQAQPSLWANAVEEILRYASPVQNSFRYPGEDVEVHGVAMRRGQYLVLALAGANRDPEVFEDPHRFDVTRHNAKDHLAFAIGPHFCLGAALARMEGEVALRKLFERFPGLTARGEGRRRPTRLLYGFAELPVELGPVEALAGV